MSGIVRTLAGVGILLLYVLFPLIIAYRLGHAAAGTKAPDWADPIAVTLISVGFAMLWAVVLGMVWAP